MSKIYIEISNLKKSFEHMSGSITLFKNFNLKVIITLPSSST